MAISHPSFIFMLLYKQFTTSFFPLFGSHRQLHQFFPSPFRFHGGLPRSMQFEVHIPSARPCRKKQNLSIHLLQQHLLHPHHTGIPFIQIRRPRVISLSESRETIRTVGESFQSQLGRLLRQSQAGSPHIVQLLPRSAHDTSAHPCQTDTCYGLFPVPPCPLRIFSTERQGATGAYLPHLSVPTPQPEESSLFLPPSAKEWKEYAPAYRVYVRRPPAPNGVQQWSTTDYMPSYRLPLPKPDTEPACLFPSKSLYPRRAAVPR